MLPLDVCLTFFAAALVLGVAPGPDNIFVLTQSALYGSRAGLMTMLGLVTGIVFHTLAVAAGVAALVQASELAFTVLKIIGAAYLVYLARLAFKSGAARTFEGSAPFPGYGALYRRGVIMNSTNPKVTLFFLAFLPQFTNPAYGSLPLQIAQLGVLFQVATVIVFGIVALLGGELEKRFNESPKGQIILNRVAGCVFLFMAVMLAVSGRN
jgi:Putative threonine efflux protein